MPNRAQPGPPPGGRTDEPWVGSLTALIQWACYDVFFESSEEEAHCKRVLAATYAPFFHRGLWLMQANDCQRLYSGAAPCLCWYCSDNDAASEAMKEANKGCSEDAPVLQWCDDVDEDIYGCWIREPHFVDWNSYWYA